MPKFIVFFFAILLCFGCQNWQQSNSSQDQLHTNKQDVVDNSNQQQVAHQEANEKNETPTDTQQHSSSNTKSSSVVDLSFSGKTGTNSDASSNVSEHNSAPNVVQEDNTIAPAEETTAQETVASQVDNHFSEEKTIEETYMEEVEDSANNSTSIENSEATVSHEVSEEGEISESHESTETAETVNTNTPPEENDTQDHLAHEAKMKAEQERLAKMQAEKERLAREAKMKAEQERLAKIQAEKERLAKIQAEKEKNRYWNSLLAKKGTYKYDIYIDKTKRGNQTTIIFEKNGDIIVKLDVTLDISTWYYSYKFKQTSTEVWRNDVVQSYDCFQDDNGTKTNLKLQKTPSGYTMTFKGKTTTLNGPLIPGSSWNLMEAYDKYPSFLVIDGGLGTTTTYAKSKIKFHNDENIKVGNTYMKCKHFSPTTGEKWSAWYSYDGTFVRYNDVVDGYLYDTVLTSVSH